MARTKKLNHFYTLEKYKTSRKGGEFKYERVYPENGTLFAGGIYKCSVRADDLPEGYVFGRYYKKFGYMSSYGVVDLVYYTGKHKDAFLKDDCLMISYSNPITTNLKHRHQLDSYSGYDERIWGKDIIRFLLAAKKYSGFDIAPIKRKIRTMIEDFKVQNPSELEMVFGGELTTDEMMKILFSEDGLEDFREL